MNIKEEENQKRNIKYKLSWKYWVVLILFPLGMMIVMKYNIWKNFPEFLGYFIAMIILGCIAKIYGKPKWVIKEIEKSKIKEEKSEKLKFKDIPSKFWNYLKKDTWDSWLVSLVLVFVFIKFIFFPLLSISMGTPLPLVVVESCSMYHSSSFDSWWTENGAWYEKQRITKQDFESYKFKNGINKGDVIIAIGKKVYEKGEVIIFTAPTKYPIIHRVISSNNEISTKGDNNQGQLDAEKQIQNEQIIGKAIFRIPALGWLKLIFFEPFKTSDQRGFCK